MASVHDTVETGDPSQTTCDESPSTVTSQNTKPHRKDIPECSSQVQQWTVDDVLDWLGKNGLHKFIPLFKEFHVKGDDLIDLRLPFLSNYDHVSISEREYLLSKIYHLLNPSTVHASEEDLTKIDSPVDKTKYYAAIQLAQGHSEDVQSHSVFVLPPQYHKTSSLTRSSPVIKVRHTSDSAVQRSGKLTRAEQTDLSKKRKTVPKSQHPAALYRSLEKYGGQCIQCVSIPADQQAHLGLTMDSENHVTVIHVPNQLAQSLHPSDRIIEINGHIVSNDEEKMDVKSLIQLQSPAQLVILTQHVSSNKKELVSMEDKWSKLHTMLVELRDSEVPELSPTALSSSISSFHQTNHLQKEIDNLKAAITDQERQTVELQKEVEDKEAMMHDLQLSRDKAIKKLQQSRAALGNTNSREAVGGNEYFNLTMESLALEDKSKEEVVESLKEIVMEASKQKWYLDRLISLVIEESPWLLDDVDQEFDNLTLTDKSEEFC